MGQAKRRKELGLMPDKTVKPRKQARRKLLSDSGIIDLNPLYSLGMVSTLYVMRKAIARANRERMNENA